MSQVSDRAVAVSIKGRVHFLLLAALALESLGTLTHQLAHHREHHAGAAVETVPVVGALVHQRVGVDGLHNPYGSLSLHLAHHGARQTLVLAGVPSRGRPHRHLGHLHRPLRGGDGPPPPPPRLLAAAAARLAALRVPPAGGRYALGVGLSSPRCGG